MSPTSIGDGYRFAFQAAGRKLCLLLAHAARVSISWMHGRAAFEGKATSVPPR